MRFNRRKYLATLGATGSALALAGCSDSDDDSNGDIGNSDSDDDSNGDIGNSDSDDDSNGDTGNGDTADSGPQYSQNSKEDMLLSVSAFPEGWFRNDGLNEEFDAIFLSADESIIVLTTVEIFDDIEGAENRIETAQAGVSEPNDYPIADEAFWAVQNELACTMFRHSNAVGQACAVRESGADVVPDQQRSQQYAQEMFDQW